MSSTKTVEILYCYSDSNKDEKLLNELEKHLSLLQHQGLIVTRHKGMVGAGKEWEKEIYTHLMTSDIVLPLISSDFIASNENWNSLAKLAMERHEAGKTHVIPILLRPVESYWKIAFPNTNALPKNQRPITDWKPYDKAFKSITEDIRVIVEELTTSILPIKESSQQVEEKIVLVTKPLSNVITTIVNTPKPAFSLTFPKPLKFQRSNRLELMIFAAPIIITISVASIFIPRLPNRLNFSLSESQKTLTLPEKSIPIGWIWLGLANSNLGNLPIGKPLLKPLDTKRFPSIDPPVVPSRGGIVTIKYRVYLRSKKSSYSQILGELQPQEKLVILKVEAIRGSNRNTSTIQLWAQVGRCINTCTR